tara:strand:+ start:1160 stop:1312 length:153 start_codon:yes stop_codon:yes gene_type:complete
MGLGRFPDVSLREAREKADLENHVDFANVFKKGKIDVSPPKWMIRKKRLK